MKSTSCRLFFDFVYVFDTLFRIGVASTVQYATENYDSDLALHLRYRLVGVVPTQRVCALNRLTVSQPRARSVLTLPGGGATAPAALGVSPVCARRRLCLLFKSCCVIHSCGCWKRYGSREGI